MPFRTAIWRVAVPPETVPESQLPNERQLEDMIVARPDLLSDDWMLIGRQVRTDLGGIIDLLAIAPDGSIVVIELKRDQTPRDVVAQALEYAAWVETLRAENIHAIYSRFEIRQGHSLAQDFHQRYGQALDEEALNQSHQIIIVAAAPDSATQSRTERVVTYLSARGVQINVMFFQVFAHGTEQLLSRTWVLDPDEPPPPPPLHGIWNDEVYCNFGVGERRSWEDARQYNFICAGGGTRFTGPLRGLEPGNRLWVKAPSYGFVGVGCVTGPAQPANAFHVNTAEGIVPVLSVAQGGNYHREFIDDPDRCEWFVPVHWLQTVPLEQALGEATGVSGLFGIPLIIAKPTAPNWVRTVERLKEKFPEFRQGCHPPAAAGDAAPSPSQT